MDKLFETCLGVLHANDRGDYCVPAGDLYPHQWLWDSCFISIGLRHLDVERAQKELTSLLRGQWANGMLPHIIFDPHPKHRRDHNMWQAWLNPHAPNGVITSGLTQPPILAEAVMRVGQKLKPADRRSWYKQVLPHLTRYHQWFYNERTLSNGLVCLLHPYESGMDNSPPWIVLIRRQAWPWWLKLLEFSHADRIVNLVRRDLRHVPPGQRITNIEAIADWNLLRKLRDRAYDSPQIIHRPKAVMVDLAFNCIFIRANSCLREIAKFAGVKLPADLLDHMEATEVGLNQLWDEQTGQYYSYGLADQSLITEPSIATLLPLYAGTISKDRAARLVELLKKRSQYKTNWPVASVPTSSDYFKSHHYWQGPTWINTNWLIISGLRRYGFTEEADDLRQKSLQLVANQGCYEYFSPLDGSPAGAANFSWTAALTIDLLQT